MSHTLTLFVLVVVIGVTGVACSSDDGKLAEYSDSMNPLLQQHLDIYGSMYDTLDQFESQLLEAARAGSINEIGNVISESSSTASLWERQLGKILFQWTILDPPEDAQRFHEMVYEMMQIRHNSSEVFRSAASRMSLGFDLRNQQMIEEAFDEIAMEDAADEYARSDRLWLQILAEARRLGGVKFIRE